MSRRNFLRESGVALATGAALSQSVHSQANTKKNILLYVVDDQGMGDASCYGHPVLRTPGLDTLAEEGVRFTHAFCTTPSCSASRSVILTGLHNHASGQYGHSHGYSHFISFDHIKSLPSRLGAAGYRTMSVGKYHVAPREVYPFDQFLSFEFRDARLPEELADLSRPFIEAVDDKPFFLYFCTNEPHRPFYRETSRAFAPGDVEVPSFLPDASETREELAKYYGSVEQADRGLLRLIEILKESGQWDNTLVVYLSDNGIAFPGAKTCLYEPGVRLPCVVRNPTQGKRGLVSDSMISWADITPTILDYAGVEYDPSSLHGRSFLSVLGEERPKGWDEVYASHTFHEITMYYPMRAIRERQFKLIWNIAYGLEFPHAMDLWDSSSWQGVLTRGSTHWGKRPIESYLHRPEFELYDLQEDPDEIHNLAGDPNHSEILARMTKKIREFQGLTSDPWIIKWEHE
ncbi:MAG: sulfatase [Candidatus Omnitrophica bacterium]|nr:sulfatase [Candidatus Omnitrophota bacterium]